MEKLKLEHLSPYLPYGLNFIFDLNDVHEEYKKENRIKMLTCDSINLCIMIGKPILRPLSDLTKEIEHNGEKFMPINKLKHLYGWDYLWYEVLGEETNFNVKKLKYACLILLLEWHFDVFGLIDKGLAIDINTI